MESRTQVQTQARKSDRTTYTQLYREVIRICALIPSRYLPFEGRGSEYMTPMQDATDWGSPKSDTMRVVN